MESLRNPLGMEAEGAGTGLVTHSAVPVNDVEAVRPTCVGSLGVVTKGIDDCGKLDPELHQADLAYLTALFKILGAGENDVVVQIARGLPDVAGMCLANVNDIESHLILVLLVQLV